MTAIRKQKLPMTAGTPAGSAARAWLGCLAVAVLFAAGCSQVASPARVGDYVLEPGHPSLAEWLLPDVPEQPAALLELGSRLFFDPGLSADGSMSCGSCHLPELGWSDGRALAVGRDGRTLQRATPTILNAGFNGLQNWDGRFDTLEDQVAGPITDANEMGTSLDEVVSYLEGRDDYRAAFARAFPDHDVSLTAATTQTAIAAFERSIVSRDSRFDRWVRGDAAALTPDEVAGFEAFLDPERGNCAVCHAPPNFTDDGFHNIGLASFGQENADPGRYAIRPVSLMRGAFKTPTLRDVARTAPYFHDGSADTLDEAIQHYVDGGVFTTNLSPSMTTAVLAESDRRNLLAFLRTLNGNEIYSRGRNDETRATINSNTVTASQPAVRKNQPGEPK